MNIQDLNEQVHADRAKHYAQRTAEPFKYPATGVRGEDTIPSVKCGFKHVLDGGKGTQPFIVNHLISDISPFQERPDLGLSDSELDIMHLWKDTHQKDTSRASHIGCRL